MKHLSIYGRPIVDTAKALGLETVITIGTQNTTHKYVADALSLGVYKDIDFPIHQLVQAYCVYFGYEEGVKRLQYLEIIKIE